MKLTKILGGALIAGVLSLSATAVYAADSISFGKPIDLSTKAAVTEYEEGMFIAVPVDIVSNTGYIDSFSIKATGAEGLTPGGTSAELGSERVANLKALGNKLVAKSGSVYVASNVQLDDGFEVSYPGTYDVAISGNKISTGWMNAEHIPVNASAPELYLVYQVTSVPEGLNVDITSMVDGECSFSDTSSGQGKTNPTPANDTQANKCAAAFKLSFEPSEMEYYIHGLSIKVNGGEAKAITDYVENGTKIEFPVRLVGDASSVEVEITASIGATESAADDTKVLYSGTLELNPTDYVAVN